MPFSLKPAGFQSSQRLRCRGSRATGGASGPKRSVVTSSSSSTSLTQQAAVARASPEALQYTNGTAQLASPAQTLELPVTASGDCLPGDDDDDVFVQDDLEAMLTVLPEDIREPVAYHENRAQLLEVVIDLGRRPEARFLNCRGGEFLREAVITEQDLRNAEAAVGEFGGDNRAGVPETLHRISAIRNRKGKIVGMTCRVGRAVLGHIDMIRDILDVPDSVLFLGRPGVGKTTVIREMARVLADDLRKRVVIVDTSNEIGGDGDVPHPAIGGARRMQVPDPSQQHRVMIEAVENHMPEVVIVDEIGTEAEALACRSIAERGVQLVGTAHGQILENLMKNPTLSDLIGGIQSVTLGDDEARIRQTQKTVLERVASPTFPRVIEMRQRSLWVTHWVEESVDMLLQGRTPRIQVRRRDPVTRLPVVEDNKPYTISDDTLVSTSARHVSITKKGSNDFLNYGDGDSDEDDLDEPEASSTGSSSSISLATSFGDRGEYHTNGRLTQSRQSEFTEISAKLLALTASPRVSNEEALQRIADISFKNDPTVHMSKGYNKEAKALKRGNGRKHRPKQDFKY